MAACAVPLQWERDSIRISSRHTEGRTEQDVVSSFQANTRQIRLHDFSQKTAGVFRLQSAMIFTTCRFQHASRHRGSDAPRVRLNCLKRRAITGPQSARVQLQHLLTPRAVAKMRRSHSLLPPERFRDRKDCRPQVFRRRLIKKFDCSKNVYEGPTPYLTLSYTMEEVLLYQILEYITPSFDWNCMAEAS